MRDTLATLLIDAMPWSNAIRALVFLALWLILWRQPTDTRLGRWTNVLFLLTFLTALHVAYLTLYLTRNATAANIDNTVEWLLIIGLNVMPLATAIAGVGVVLQTIRATTFIVSNEGVIGTMAQALPIIVADHTGVIRHTTDPLDTLVGSVPGSLIGKHLEVLMPERYIADHQYGIDRYVRTREPHIIGTTVAIEMLRQDGTEIPVYLSLMAGEDGGNPVFIATIFPAPDPLSARERQADIREAAQDETATVQAETTKLNTQRGKFLTEAGILLDANRTKVDTDRTAQNDRRDEMDVRDKAQDARQVEQDEDDRRDGDPP